MKLKNKIAVLGLSLFALSCTDLDTTNSDYLTGDQYPETTEQAINLATPVFAKTSIMLDGGGWWFTQEITSDEAVGPTRGADWEDNGKWRALFKHTWGPESEAVNQLYGMIYNVIPQANYAIETLTPTADSNADVAKVLAQVKVSRAYYFYLAIDNFGDIPFPTTFIGANEFPSRTPRAEVFAAIVKDIEDNVALLPKQGDPGVVRSDITQGMAYTLLAKLYLNAKVYTGTAQWQKAINACDKVLALGYSLEAEPLAPFATANENSKENIYTIAYDQDKAKGFNLHMRTLNDLNQQTFNMTVAPWNGFATLEAHYNSFPSNDKRLAGILIGQQKTKAGEDLQDPKSGGANLVFTANIPNLQMSLGTNTQEQIRMAGARPVKWEIADGARDNLSNDFPLFRLADVILMKAEALVWLNGAGSGDALVNQIKARAGIAQTSGYTTNDILAERGREMMWEGHRRQDLIRHGKFENIWWEKTDTDPNRRLFPIPQYAINANKNLLPQNPGY